MRSLRSSVTSMRPGVAAGVALALVASGFAQSASAAPSDDGGTSTTRTVDEAAREKRRPKTQTLASVPVTPVAYEPELDAGTAPSPEAPAVTWPDAGAAEIDLTADGSASGSAGRSARNEVWTLGSRSVRVPVRSVRAGSLPVRVGVPTTAGTPATTSGARDPLAKAPEKVRVRVHSRAQARQAGVEGLLLSVNRTDGVRSEGSVGLEVDYATFAEAFGGDWASRLRVSLLPGCALTTPEVPRCRVGTVLATRNDLEARRLVAEVPAPAASPSGTSSSSSSSSTTARTSGGTEAMTSFASAASVGVLSVSAGASGAQGTYAATSLSPVGSWQAGGNTGTFSWSYPMRVPPAVAGPSPELSLSYSSASVDGRTSSTNSQTSWIGEGFDLNPGFIERSYRSCEDDGHDELGEQKYDLCWHSDNATMSFGSRNGELVKKSDGTWRLKSDDGTKIERKTGGFNDDNNDEYWLVTTPDGSRYYFGKGKRTSADTENTNSSWEVPVYGDDSGEPCHDDSFADSRCSQTWRWNLDYVVDAHGNSMTYYWAQETNRYGADRDDVSVKYDRGGYLKRIEYGQVEGKENASSAPARVLFTVEERCDGADDVCEPDDLTDSTAWRWRDVPQDQICTDTDSCEDQWSPSFFSRKRLTAVTTQVLGSGGTYEPVDVWNLAQSYPDAGDASTDSLWLDSVTHSGKANGATITLPPTTFQKVQLPNRVDTDTDDRLPFNKYRMRAVQLESGGVISVNYRAAECTAGSLPTPHTNTKACYPSFWSEEGKAGDQEDWFHKYLVSSVVESDQSGNGIDKVTSYSYLGGAAWHYDDNELAKSEKKTWSQFRGYQTVRTTTGNSSSTQLRTETTYLRGMDGDRLNEDGGSKSVVVESSNGVKVTDKDRYQGFTLESRTFNGVGGAEVTATVNEPWLSEPTATEGKDKAELLGIATTTTRTALDNGALRTTRVRHTYDGYGMVSTSSDEGDLGVTTDDTCTRYSYARSASAHLLTLLKRVETVAKLCSATPVYPTDAISDIRTWYDGRAYGEEPTKGDVTRTEQLSGYSGGVAQYLTTGRSEYDVHGRVTVSYDAKNNKTQTAYRPTTGGPVTGMTVTDAASFATTSTVDPAWGLVTSTVDANSQRTDQQYDALGRLIKVWMPGRIKGTDLPNIEYSYLIRQDGPVAVTTKELLPNGAQQASYQLYDGLLRARQTQAPSPTTGRVVTDTMYDSRGLAVRQVGPYYNASAPGTTLVDTSQAAEGTPAESESVFDGAGRTTASIFRVAGVEKWRTTTAYHGDRTDVTPPAGETPTTTYTDAQGRTTKLLEYKGTTPSGTADTTLYTYTRAGRLETVKDTAGNLWSYGYDLLGRQTSASDPDAGASSTKYDELGRVVETKDARSVVLSYAYDAISRPTAVKQITTSGSTQTTTQLLGWTYDSAVNGKGRIAKATRYANGAQYAFSVSAYDVAGRPTKQSVVIPSVENKLAGTYTVEAVYKADGSLASTKLPAMGGLAAETLTTGYNSFGLPSYTSGTIAYVRDTVYSSLSEPLQYTMAQSSSSSYTWLTYAYEQGTRRLQNARVDREIAADPDADVTYAYDAAGNVTKISDAPKNHTPDVQCFQYDYLRRLTEAWAQKTTSCATTPAQSVLGGPAPYWQSFTYDATGSRKTDVTHAVTSTGTTTTRTYTMNGVGVKPAHGVKSVAVSAVTSGVTTTSTQSLTYDAVGDTLTRTSATGAAQTLTYDAEGHVSSITQGGKKTSFVYSPTGDRLIRRDEAAKSVTLYLGSTELRLNTTNTDVTQQTVTGTRYYRHNGQTVAVRTSAGVTWLAGGQNGTAELAIAASTSTLTQRRTLPFGELRGTKPTWTGERGFVGGTNDTTTALVHLGAREYDPVSGRFLSVDPVIDYGDPQQLNGYAYGRNNPLVFPDPTGLWWGSSWNWSAIGHATLDVVGLVPVIGEVADVANGAWYAAEGDYVNAALSFASAIPLAGYAATAVKGAKYVDAGVDAAKTALKASDEVGDAAKMADNLTPPATPKAKPAPAPDPPATPKTPDGAGKPKADGKPEASGKPKAEDGPAKSDGASPTEAAGDGITAPGPHAGRSIPAKNGPSRDFTPDERSAINEIGRDTGCHRCGSTDPGTKSGNFVPDHQPANALNPESRPQQLFPHCKQCSWDQAREINRILRSLMKED